MQEFCIGDGKKVVKHSCWSNYSYCSLIGRVNAHERVDESDIQLMLLSDIIINYNIKLILLRLAIILESLKFKTK
jgi:hypothetical protein